MQGFDHSSDYPSTPNSIRVGTEQPVESQVIPHWSWTTCTKWQAEKRLLCLPEPAEMNAELSTLSPHFLFVFVAGVILGICYVLTHRTLSSPDSEHYLNSNYELHSY